MKKLLLVIVASLTSSYSQAEISRLQVQTLETQLAELIGLNQNIVGKNAFGDKCELTYEVERVVGGNGQPYKDLSISTQHCGRNANNLIVDERLSDVQFSSSGIQVSDRTQSYNGEIGAFDNYNLTLTLNTTGGRIVSVGVSGTFRCSCEF